MERGLHLLTCLALAAVAGCRGCSDDAGGPEGADAVRTEQSARARLLSRMSTRKLDRSKVYPKDERGHVRCDRDVDCFILQAERCTPSWLLYEQSVTGYGVTQHVQARYRITGTEVNRCKLERETLQLDVTLAPALIDTLHKRGKSEQEIAVIRSDGLTTLRRRNPARIECFLTGDQALEASLNIAENLHDPLRWRSACRELPGKPPQIGSGEPAAAPAQPAPPAQGGATVDASAAPAARTDVPAPKQP